MKFFLLYFFSFIFFIEIYPQFQKVTDVLSNSFSIIVKTDNADYTEEVKGSFKVRDYYNFTDETNPATYKLPCKEIVVAIPPYSKPVITLVSKEEKRLPGVIPELNPGFTINEDKSFSYKKFEIRERKKNQPENLIEILDYFWLRDFYCVRIRINNHFFDESAGSLVEYDNVKLKFTINNANFKNQPIEYKSDFDKNLAKIIYNSSIAEQFRSKPDFTADDSSGSWINYNAEYIKIGTANDGIVRLTYDDLYGLGINAASINPVTFRLIESGNELPIYVSGEEDGVFEPGDYIEFFGTKNYSDISARIINSNNTPYNEYLNRYTDTTIYFLTWGGNNGKRVYGQNNFKAGLTDTINYYTDFRHYEKNITYQPLSSDEARNQDPAWLETNGWYYAFFISGVNNQFEKVDNEIVPNNQAKFYYKVVSEASSVPFNSHNLSLMVNGTTIDSQVADRNDRILLQGTVNTNSLIGAGNTISIVNHPNGIFPNRLIEDWYEVEYPRYLKLINDSLLFEIRYMLDKKERIIKVENVNSTDIKIYKVKPELKKIENIIINSSVLYFTDSVETGDAYVVISESKIKKPDFFRRKFFANLRNPSFQADYIAISHPSLLPAVDEYVDFINDNYSLNASLFMIDDIFDEFGYGYPDPEAIKSFLKSAVELWQDPKPSYLNLIGSASYDYKNYLGNNVNKNLVPSFGEPVSDSWFTMLSENSLLQQLIVSRIPANSPDEVLSYLEKHSQYLNQQYDLWNKRALFFSGGDENNQNQLNTLRNVNNAIINNYASQEPFVLDYDHFYKTSNPFTNFGPYSNSYVNNSIREGGSFISYLGHSGTTTWDNSINDPDQLLNIKNKNPLITDFGCSTNRFAEPNLKAFGNLFVLDGQAIGYIGNSSLGYLASSTRVPQYFYESILRDSILRISEAHYDAKLKLFSEVGTSGVYRIFALTNLLLGDPLVSLALPDKPNLTTSASDFSILSLIPDENMDSLGIKVKFYNLGSAAEENFKLLIENYYQNVKNFSDTLNLTLPEFVDSLTIYIPVKNRAGLHNLNLKFDSENEINELNEDDNIITFNFNVASLSLKPIIYNDKLSVLSDELILLNHIDSLPLLSNKIITEIDTTEFFTTSNIIETELDTFFTSINLSSLIPGKRYWLRTRLDVPVIQWGESITFIKSDRKSDYFIQDSYSVNEQILKSLFRDNEGIKLSVDSFNIAVESGGGNVSKYGSIKLNGTNILPNTFSWGMGIAVFDSSTFEIDTAETFWYGDNSPVADTLAALINSIPLGKIVAMNVIDDGRSNLNANLRNAIKTLGSTKVDSISTRGPWVLIGRKGAAPGDVIEIVKSSSYPEILITDTTFTRFTGSGSIKTTTAGPASKWNEIIINQQLPENSEINYKIFGINNSGIETDLGYFNLQNNKIILSSIDAKTYPFIYLLAELEASPDGSSPVLNSIEIDFDGVPEPASNFQVISLSKDSIENNEENIINFAVINEGESSADSLNVLFELLKPDNSKRILIDSTINISSGEIKTFSHSFKPLQSDGYGNMSFAINIDPENNIKELFEDNNYIIKPFFVKPDTSIVSVSPASVTVTYNGIEIADGDYLPSNPDIEIIFNYPGWFSPLDTTAIEFYLNQKRINYQELGINYDTVNRRIIYNYSPVLEDGEYTLRVYGANIDGNLEDLPGYQRYFIVSSIAKLSEAYNYPNPFHANTYFTFRLTQIPDEIKIKIYTVAGRLIREIPVEDFKINFNKVEWDGRDQDGDLVGNGVYLYKVILKQGSNHQDIIQKLAIVR